MRKNHVWVVEIWYEEKWIPCVGIGLDKEQGKMVLRQWRRENPYSKFRLQRYESMAGAAR